MLLALTKPPTSGCVVAPVTVYVSPCAYPPLSALPDKSVIPVPAAFTSSLTVPLPVRFPTTTTYSDALAAATACTSPVSPPLRFSVKSPASTPLTSRLNLTRYATLLAVTPASCGIRRLTPATCGACVSTRIVPALVSFTTYASSPPADVNTASPWPGSKSTTPA